VMHEIEQSKGRAATDDEIAQALGITEDEFSDWQNQMKITGLVSLDEFVESGADVASSPSSQTTTHFLSPEENIDKKELTEKLSEALSGLSDKEQQIITFYYYEEMTLKEIAQVLDVSESRISQLHTRALKKMKDKLGPYMNILTHSV
ncbi:MAG: sigma-70 family RNA polymerase sigma factor, partial [Lachnospiraceae bacterium]|nr:sigma-70 family RNA polymerase sigma factor [Lachnospiraceae bacterium]